MGTITDRLAPHRSIGLDTSIFIYHLKVIHPWKQGRSDVAQQYEAILVNFPHLSLINVDRDVARRAAQLRANYNIRPADAIHVATAMVNGATAFVSNDHKFQRLGKIIDIVILDDLLTNG
jgi:predicted nucleic acid-binding protein